MKNLISNNLHNVSTLRKGSKTSQESKCRIMQCLWRVEIVYISGFVLFVMLAILAHFYPYFELDTAIQHSISQISLPGFGEFMRLVSIPADGRNPYAIAVLTALVFFVMRLPREAAGVLFVTMGSGMVNGGIKMLIARPRPVPSSGIAVMEWAGNSFPSGHVTFYVCYFGFLFFVAAVLMPANSAIRRLAMSIMIPLILLIGFSRVFLGAHYPSDTLGSYLLGGLWLGLTIKLFRRWNHKPGHTKLANTETLFPSTSNDPAL